MKDRYELKINQSGSKFYSKNNKCHREDGPANIFPSRIYFRTVDFQYCIDGYLIRFERIKNYTIIKGQLVPLS